jgi:hypothetical protein
VHSGVSIGTASDGVVAIGALIARVGSTSSSSA